MLLKFIDQWYLGMKGDIGFMTPDGTDSAAKKRKSTVDSWSGGHMWNPETKKHELQEPKTSSIPDAVIEGPEILNSVSRGGSYYGSQDKWKIKDPRGFILEITSANIQVLHKYCTIINGVVQGKCRWAREGANNVLVPETAPEFQVATENTKKLASDKIDPATIPLGANCEMASTLGKGRYLGSYYLGEYAYSNGIPSITKKKWAVFRTGNSYQTLSDPKVVSYTMDEGELTQEEALKLVNTNPAKETTWRGYISGGQKTYEIATLDRDELVLEYEHLGRLVTSSGGLPLMDLNTGVIVTQNASICERRQTSGWGWNYYYRSDKSDPNHAYFTDNLPSNLMPVKGRIRRKKHA